MSRFFEPHAGTPNPSDNVSLSELLANPGRRTLMTSGSLAALA